MSEIIGIGVGGLPTNAPPGNNVGVYGQGGEGNSDGVQGVANGGFSGVAGFGGPENGTGVFGLGGAARPTLVWMVMNAKPSEPRDSTPTIQRSSRR
jgi:hypothetical protein